MTHSPSRFGVAGQDFLLDGRPWRLLAGAIHYFRVHPAQWEDRLLKLRALGLNTVETYVAWNLHEPEPGRFVFDGALDLVAFVRLAERLGLKVIVRPGPYICAEWEFGGLPAWLLADPEMVLRSSYPPYLAAVDRFFAALLPRLLPLQIDAGGPLLAMQVENEYGSYGSDQAYLRWLEGRLRHHGVSTLLFTSDGPTDHMLSHGTLPGVLKTGNFGSRVPEQLAKLREHQPEGPLVCMEFWNGWFDHWGEPHHTRDAKDAADCLDQILAAGAGVNIFMFHGGSSFGYMNGANTDAASGQYQPTVNSYDYDAPLAEDGSITPKYLAMREAIARHGPDRHEGPLAALQLPEPAPRLPDTTLALQPGRSLWSVIEGRAPTLVAPATRSMEQMGQAYGYLLYRTRLRHPPGPVQLSVQAVHDRAQVFVNGQPQGVLERDGPRTLEIQWPAGEVCLELLVENLGRVNYGPWLHDRKGLLGFVRLGIQLIQHWEHHSLPLPSPPDDVARFDAPQAQTPRFHTADFELEQPGDGFLSLQGAGKGQVWVNGFHLGRHWQRGPQHALYLPWPLLRVGRNELVVLEQEAPTGQALQARLSPQRPDSGPSVDMAPLLATLF